MERPHSYRSGIPVLYVYYGSFHVLFIAEIRLQIIRRKCYESTETDRADLPGRICLEFIRTSLLQRIFQFRKPAYPGSYATAGTGLRDRLTDRIIR